MLVRSPRVHSHAVPPAALPAPPPPAQLVQQQQQHHQQPGAPVHAHGALAIGGGQPFTLYGAPASPPLAASSPTASAMTLAASLELETRVQRLEKICLRLARDQPDWAELDSRLAALEARVRQLEHSQRLAGTQAADEGDARLALHVQRFGALEHALREEQRRRQEEAASLAQALRTRWEEAAGRVDAEAERRQALERALHSHLQVLQREFKEVVSLSQRQAQERASYLEDVVKAEVRARLRGEQHARAASEQVAAAAREGVRALRSEVGRSLTTLAGRHAQAETALQQLAARVAELESVSVAASGSPRRTHTPEGLRRAAAHRGGARPSSRMRSSFVALADADRESAADLGSARMPSLPPLPRASASSLAAALAASAAARGGAEVLRREDLERLPTASEPDAERRVPPAQRRPRTGDRFAAGGRFDDGFDSARAVPVDKGAEPAALFALGAVGASQSLSLAAPDLHLSMLPLPPRPTRREVDDEEKRGSDDRFPVVQRQEHSQQHDREDQLVGTRAVKDAEEKVESPPNGAAALGEVAAAGGLELVLLSVADPQPRHAAPLARVSVAEISCGGRHWAAVTDDGGLWMWGDNECGQLGCGDREPRAEPVFISTLRGVATAACGVRHTLACTRAGELFSWGSAANGCLGLSARSVEPQDPAVSAAAAVAVAASDEVAKVGVDADGEVEAYEEDANHEAQASAADANVPQRVEALAGMHVAGVACGAANSAAITVGEAAASLWLWGAGACGQIGDGAGRARRAPKRVELDVSGGGVAQVSLGARHAAAVLADGRLFVWGDNSMGQLGLALEGGRTCSLAPLPLPLGDGELAAQAACGDAHTSALTRAGNLWSWGSGATKQLGVEQPAQLAGPTLIAGFPGLRQVCVGSEMTAAVTAAGDLFLWGAPIQSATPLRVDTLADVSVAAACVAVRGAFAALYCAAAGAVLVEWGGAQVSQLRVEQMAPLRGRRLRAVARGAEHSVAVTESGSVLTWGGNANGQLGTGEGVAAAPLPRSVALIEPVVEVACGRDHTLALSVSGTLFAWGCGSLGRLGLRSEADSSRPKLVDALANVKLCGVACSAFNSAAVAIDGRLFVWGAGRAGQLGGGVATSPALEPMHVANLGRAVARVALGDEHVAAIDTAGSLLTWGSNARGQLGRPDAGGGDEQIGAPGEVVVPEDEPVTDVRCCGLATLALSDGGSVLGCGAAELNVLALHPPPADDARTLAPVAALAAARCSAIAAGAGAFAAVGTGGEVFVWGSDLHAPVRIDEALGDAAAVKGIALGVGHAILFADRLP